MSRDRPSLGTAGTSRRRFLRGVAGFSFGAASLGALAACRGPAARPASKRLPLNGVFLQGTAESSRRVDKPVLEGLEALGYREGQTIKIEWRFSGDSPSNLTAIAQELVDLRPDVIVAGSPPLVQSLLDLTRTVPIVSVLALSDPAQMILRGFIKSQARPGGNVTGLVGGAPTLPSKRLDLLHEALPGATRLAVLRDSSGPGVAYLPYPTWASHVTSLSASGPEELDGIFARFEQEHAELLAVDSRGQGRDLSAQFGEQTRRHRLPAIGDFDAFAPSGGLMSYGPDFTALFRGAGRYVDKFLKGASPADLPVELPTTFRFVINKATANTLGLTIPPAVLAQATEALP